jgi:hypothetical protein
MDIEFFEPAEAAALMRCTESWLRDGATSGRFPHACWGKGKIIFTSEHILEIAKLSEISFRAATPPSLSTNGRRLRKGLSAPEQESGLQQRTDESG